MGVYACCYFHTSNASHLKQGNTIPRKYFHWDDSWCTQIFRNRIFRFEHREEFIHTSTIDRSIVFSYFQLQSFLQKCIFALTYIEMLFHTSKCFKKFTFKYDNLHFVVYEGDQWFPIMMRKILFFVHKFHTTGRNVSVKTSQQGRYNIADC